MKLTPKTLAYVFFAVCILVTAYILYDTFKIASGQKDVIQGEDSQDSIDSGELVVNFEDFEINLSSKASLIDIDEKKVYFFKQEQICEEMGMMVDNPNLIGVMDYGGDIGRAELGNVIVYRRTIEGNVTEISTVPEEIDVFGITETGETSRLQVEVDLSWDERSIRGNISSFICKINENV